MKKTYTCSLVTQERILTHVHDTIVENGCLPSIKEVCEELDITRGTFYLHFASMQEAHAALKRERVKLLEEMCDALWADTLQMRLLPHTFVCFDWLKRDLPYYRRLCLSADEILGEGIAVVIARVLPAVKGASLCFAQHGALGFLQDWLQQRDALGAYEAAKRLDALLACVRDH